jgi:hypothetical protein
MKSLWGFLARPPLARERKGERQERLRQERKAALVARRTEVRAAKQQAAAEGALRRQEEERLVEAERVAREAVTARAYQHYLEVRERLRSVRDEIDSASVALTPAERQMAAALAHLWDATPETIATLRRCGESVSGVRPADYELPSPDLATRLRREVAFLRRQIGQDVFVSEPPILGGFGCVRNGDRYNEDTVRFFKALAALHDGGVLGEFRRASQRRVVWELGGGWGGFAHQFKTICPNVTYLITGIPELLLLSAVYLMTAFPGARCRVLGEEPAGDVWRDWEDIDFIFAPEGAVPALQPPRIDLTLDIMALRNMGESRVRCHVHRSFTLGSRYFYSLMPGTSSAGEPPSAWKLIEQRYWTHPVPPRTDEALLDEESSVAPDADYAHLVGWRRMRV